MKDTILFGDCRDTLSTLNDKVQMCVTSPPYYGLRNYGDESNQIGQEDTPEEYIQNLVSVFQSVKNVLADDGTLWLNMGDSYYNYRPGKGQALVKQTVSATKQDLPDKCARRGNKLDGLKEKDLIGIPWMLAFALRADGWYLRQDIIWHKPNPMPESVKDRCTKGTGLQPHSGLTKSYPKKNKRSVWSITNKPYKGAHFATFPRDLVEPCILAGSRVNDTILDPFMGSGTTAMVAKSLGRYYIGCELHESYGNLIYDRTAPYHANLEKFV